MKHFFFVIAIPTRSISDKHLNFKTSTTNIKLGYKGLPKVNTRRLIENTKEKKLYNIDYRMKPGITKMP
jgi:hypothetical protein